MKLFLSLLLLSFHLNALTLPHQLRNNDILSKLDSMETAPKNAKLWLFVIGIENYDDIDNVKYSKASAESFIKVMQKLKGVYKRQTYAIIEKRATSGRIKSELTHLLSNVKENDTIYFYYSGHGIPVIPSKEPYILPKDMTPAIIGLEPAFKLENIYHRLSSSKASKVIAIIDSCFSGSTDGKSLFKGVAASRLVAKEVLIKQAKMAVITAGKDEEFSNMYQKKSHRLFSYYIMEGILKGKTDLQSLFNYTQKNVQKISFDLGDQYKQTPTFSGNHKLSL